MSTEFFVDMPMADFIEAAEGLGWRRQLIAGNEFALVSKKGHYCRSIRAVAAGTVFARYGKNTDVYDLAEAIGAACEDDCGFDGIIARSEGRIKP